MNRRHRSAQLAGRASVQLHTLIFFSDEKDDNTTTTTTNRRTASSKKFEEDAYVLDVDTTEQIQPSLTVIVPRYGIEGRIRLPISSDDPNLQRFPEQHKITYNVVTSTASSDDVDSKKDTANTAATATTVSIQVFDKVRVNIWVQREEDHKRELIIDLVRPEFKKKQNNGKEKEENNEKVQEEEDDDDDDDDEKRRNNKKINNGTPKRRISKEAVNENNNDDDKKSKKKRRRRS